MAGSNMFLYWGSGSTPCWRVMIVLEEKALEGYGHKQIDFFKGEHKCTEILLLNHRGQVSLNRILKSIFTNTEQNMFVHFILVLNICKKKLTLRS